MAWSNSACECRHLPSRDLEEATEALGSYGPPWAGPQPLTDPGLGVASAGLACPSLEVGSLFTHTPSTPFYPVVDTSAPVFSPACRWCISVRPRTPAPTRRLCLALPSHWHPVPHPLCVQFSRSASEHSGLGSAAGDLWVRGMCLCSRDPGRSERRAKQPWRLLGEGDASREVLKIRR